MAAAGRGGYSYTCYFPEKELCLCLHVCVCLTMQRAKVSVANVLTCRVFTPKPGTKTWTGTGDRVGKGAAEASEDSATIQSFIGGTPLVLSVDVQAVGFFQAKPGLVLVKKALEGRDVHFMVHIHNLVSWILNFWHSDRLPNYNRTGEGLKQRPRTIC